MEATQATNHPTFESVWAALQETKGIFKEIARRQEETDRQMKENEAKFDREIKKTERIVARNGKQIGGLHRRFGQLAEHLVAPGIEARFNELGYHFETIATRGCKIIVHGKTLTEIDILLENGETIIAVEVKATPAVKDIEHHIKRLEILRDFRIKMSEKRKTILGAIAGAIYANDVKKAVSDAGLFVIEQSGDTMKIDMPEDFVLRKF
jgi:hypothetical protein